MPAAAAATAAHAAAPPPAPESQQATAAGGAAPSQGNAPPAPLPALAFAPCAATAPVRRVVSILQTSIASLEKQAKMKAKSKDQNNQQSGNVKSDEISPLLEFAWDLVKQVMGIAVLSENEAKKQARKDSALRKAQDLQLIHEVLLLLACFEEINNPANRTSFLSGTNGIDPVSSDNIEAIDKIYPELSRNPVVEEGAPSFHDQTMNAAKHLLAIIEGDTRDVFGTTYAHIKDVVTNVHQSGYFDHPKESIPEVEHVELSTRDDATEEVEQVSPPVSTPIVPVNPPPPAPQAVPTPAFSILPPRAPPVTLQQVEHAYFAQQYGHQHQPVPEVFGPQSFIFIQDSELDSADISQQPTPRPASPASIPSQTFTNQSFTIPQHFTPDVPPNPHLPLTDIPQPVLYPSNVNDVQNAIANFSAANAPPPIPMPPAHPPIPPHISMASAQVVTHPHTIQQQRLPSPSFQQPLSFTPQPTHPSEPLAQSQNETVQDENKSVTPVEHVELSTGPATAREWLDNSQIENRSEQLEIDEWNPETVASEGTAQTNGQSSDKVRPRSRGRGGMVNNFRSRGNGGYQTARPGSYYRNNDNGQPNNTVNGGGNYDNNYRENRNDGNRFENSQGYQGNYRGRGPNRGSRQNGNARGLPRNGQSRGGGGGGTGGARSQYIRKTSTSNGQFETRNGIGDSNKQTYAH